MWPRNALDLESGCSGRFYLTQTPLAFSGAKKSGRTRRASMCASRAAKTEIPV